MTGDGAKEREDPREPCPKHPDGVHEDILERKRNENPDGRVDYLVMSAMCRRCGATVSYEDE